MAFQFVNPAPVLFDLLGIEPAAGGSLLFYERGTTTPKDTWSDPDLAVLNSNPVLLDSSGRSNTQIWMDGEYTVVLRDGDGEQVWAREMGSGQAAGTTIPDLIAGRFLTNNGTDLLWSTIRQVPDPTGSANRILSTDGANLIWIPQPTIPPPPDLPIGSGDNFAEFGDTLIQWGTGTGPATGTDFSQSNITFGRLFAAPPPFVGVTVATNNINGTSLVAIGVTAIGVSGCVVDFNNADRHYQGSSKLTGPIPYMWMAIGKKPAA